MRHSLLHVTSFHIISNSVTWLYKCAHILAAMMMAWLCTFAWLISLLFLCLLFYSFLSLLFGIQCLHRLDSMSLLNIDPAARWDETRKKTILKQTEIFRRWHYIDWRQSMQLFKPADENYDITFWPFRCTFERLSFIGCDVRKSSMWDRQSFALNGNRHRYHFKMYSFTTIGM